MPRRRGGTTGRRPAAGAGYDSFLNDLWEKDKKQATTTKTPPSSGGAPTIKPVEEKKPAAAAPPVSRQAPPKTAFDACHPNALGGGDAGGEGKEDVASKAIVAPSSGKSLSSQSSLEKEGKVAEAPTTTQVDDEKKDLPKSQPLLPEKAEKDSDVKKPTVLSVASESSSSAAPDEVKGANEITATKAEKPLLPPKKAEKDSDVKKPVDVPAPSGSSSSAALDEVKGADEITATKAEKPLLPPKKAEKDSDTKKAVDAPAASKSLDPTRKEVKSADAETETKIDSEKKYLIGSLPLLSEKAKKDIDINKATAVPVSPKVVPSPPPVTVPSTESTNTNIDRMTKNVQTKVSTIISSINKKTDSVTAAAATTKLSKPTTSKPTTVLPSVTKKILNHNDDDEPCEPSFAYDNSASVENEETEDLLPSSPSPSSTEKGGSSSRGIPKKQYPSQQPPTWNPIHAGLALLGLIYARLIYHYTYHRTESILAFIFLCSLMLMIHHASTIKNKKIEYIDPFLHSKIDDSLSNIHSELDLHIGDVDHWCIGGDNDSCMCEDPTEPSFGDRDGWIKAHKRNRDYAEWVAADGSKGVLSEDIEQWDDDWGDDYYIDPNDDNELETIQENGYDENGNEVKKERNSQSSSSSSGIDVVFLGDSITEQRQGTAVGNVVDDWGGIKTVFEKQFTREKGGKFEGIALGVAGDTSPNLLWRIMNGEIPDNLNPSVFWITIGTNDFKNTQCSEEIVLLGILRIVEEIQYRKPSATIVINSILPISTASNGLLESKSRFRSIRSGQIDFWPSIKSVNEELEKFASEQHGVKFFDADKIFVGERSDGTYIVDGTMMPDNVHPSKEGHKAWGKAITEKLETILNKH